MKTPSNAQLRLQSLDDQRLRLGPQTVHLDITNACNTDCVTCWDHSPHLDTPQSITWKRQRADPRRLREVVDDIESLGGLEAVIVSGMGEPFTHPDVYEILGDLKRRGLHVTVITNLLAADADEIIALGVDTLLIGIHGATERAYLDFHPSWSPAHWQRLHTTLERLRDAGRRDKHVQVICRTNAHQLLAMVEQAHRYRAHRLNFKLASLAGGTQAVAIDDRQRLTLLGNDIDVARHRADELGVVHNLDVFEAQVRAGGALTAPIEDIGCFLGYHYSRITVDGTVLYCCNTEVVVGSLATGERFSTLWTGPAWEDLRARLRAGRYFPGCVRCGKLNQNVKLSKRFRERFGEQRWQAATGTSLASSAPTTAAPDVSTGRPPSLHDVQQALARRGLKVLP
ncbi:MAG: radical SAM protein [Deltaproteobacteria bacterium]|nr:radical SAM protein [Deltaproteobacteria bacterium]